MVEFNGSLFLMLTLGGLILIGIIEVAREAYDNGRFRAFLGPLFFSFKALAGIICFVLSLIEHVAEVAARSPLNRPAVVQRQVTISSNAVLYHGGSRSAILDIFHNKRILVGGSGKGWWLTKDFEDAAYFASEKGSGQGYIIAVKAHPGAELEDQGDNRYVAVVPNYVTGKYYWFNGIQILGVYDIDNNRIL